MVAGLKLTSRQETAASTNRTDLWIVQRVFELVRGMDGVVYRLLASVYGTRAHAGGEPDLIHFFVGSLGLGGTQRQLATLIRRLTAQGFRCKVWVQHSESFFAGDLELAGAQWERVSPASESKERRSLSQRLAGLVEYRSHVWMALALRRRLLREKPTVLQCLLDTTNVSGALAGRMAGVPVVVAGLRSLHPRARGESTPPFQRRAYRLLSTHLVEAVVANSESGRRSFLTWQPTMPTEKVHVIHNGLEEPATSPASVSAIRDSLGIAEDCPVLLWAGRFAAEKRPDSFLATCAGLSRSGRRFVALMIGDGQDRAAVERLVSELAVEHCVRLLGVRRDVAELIRMARVTVLTSETEGLPNILIEASLCGCPVVATRTGGVDEIVEHGVTGFLADVGDHAALCAHVALLIDDEALARAMGERASVRARRAFDPARMADQTLSLYRELAMSRGVSLEGSARRSG
jgi:glycosyltransferase involved in cell wall biosynthesis